MPSQPEDPRLWETLETRDVFAAEPRLVVSVDSVRLPDGRIVEDYYRVRMTDYAVVFARTAEGKVILEEQYKHGVGAVVLTLPTGAIEPGENPMAAAQRELREETGYAAADWRPLGRFMVNGNQGCGRAHLFTARNARFVAEPDSGDLEEMRIVLLSPEDALAAVLNGELPLLSGAATIALAMCCSGGAAEDKARE